MNTFYSFMTIQLHLVAPLFTWWHFMWAIRPYQNSMFTSSVAVTWRKWHRHFRTMAVLFSFYGEIKFYGRYSIKLHSLYVNIIAFEQGKKHQDSKSNRILEWAGWWRCQPLLASLQLADHFNKTIIFSMSYSSYIIERKWQ